MNYRTLLSTIFALFVIGCSSSKTVTESAQGTNRPSSHNQSATVVQIGTQKFDNPFLFREFVLSGETDTTSTDKYADFIKRYTALKLKVKEAERLGLDKDSSLVVDLSNYRTQLGRPYLLENAIYKPLIAEAYEREKINVQVSHILIAVDAAASPEDTLIAYQKAVAVRDSALKGIDFNQLALHNSSDPSVARNRGTLPLVTRGKYIYPFETIAYNTPVGQISPLVRSKEFGYHFLKVESRQPAAPSKQFAQIFIQPKGTSSQDSTDAKARVQDVMNRLNAGTPFDELAKQINDDDFLKERGGDIGLRKRGDLIEPLDSAAFALNTIGQISEPLLSSFGWHIFKLTAIDENKSLEQKSAEIRNQLQSNPYLQDFVLKYSNALRPQLPLSLNQEAFNQAIASVPADSLFEELAPSGKSLRKTFGDTEIADYNGMKINFIDFADYAYRRPKQPTEDNKQAVSRLLQDLISEKTLDAYTLTLDKKDEKFANLIQKYRDGTLMFKISQDSIWTPAGKDSVGLKTFFAANSERYKFGERTKAISFYSTADSLIYGIASSLGAGESPEAIAARFKGNRNVRYETVYLVETTNSIYDKVLTLEVNKPTAPEPYQRGKVILINAGKEAPRNKTYEESLSELTGDYQQVVESNWIARLYTKYGVQIFPQNIKIPSMR